MSLDTFENSQRFVFHSDVLQWKEHDNFNVINSIININVL